MKDHLRQQIALLVIAAATLLTGLQANKLWDEDEGYFASAAAEMHARGDWIVPTFNDELFGHKPPWMYWMMMIGFELFGTTEFAARVFSAVFRVATCWLTFHVGRRMFDANVGWWAGLVMASCLFFNFVSRAATADAYLTFFATLALYLFAITGPCRHSAGTEDSADQSDKSNVLPQRWSDFVLIYAVMGLATLVKGPIGFLFPMAVIGLFLLCMTPTRDLGANASWWSRWRETLRPFGPVNFLLTVWKMRIFTAIGVILLVAGPWYVLVGLKTNGAFLQEFFGVHHFHRFSTPMDSHSGPFFYYLVAVLVGMFPWSIFALPTLLLVVRQLRNGSQHSRALALVTCWAGVYLVIFSLASTKLPNYVLPAYPALAMLMAYFYQYWIENPTKVHRAWPRIAVSILVAVGGIVLIGLPLAGLLRFGGHTLLDRVGLAQDVQSQLMWLGPVGIPACAGGIAALYYAEHKRITAAVSSIAWASALTMLVLWNYAAPQVAAYQINGRVGAAIRNHIETEDVAISAFGYFPPSLAFYVRQRIDCCHDSETTHQFLDDSGARLLITTSDRYDELKPDLSDDTEILERLDRFPERGEIVILRRSNSSHARTAQSPSKGITSNR